MERELLFKVWDKEKKRMSEPFSLGAFLIVWNDGGIEIPVPFAEAKYKRFVFLQYTGKKDSKGEKIWHKDLVEFDREEWGSDNNVFAVEWDEEDASWNWGGGCTSDMSFRTVIGNVYENSELLKGKK